MGKWIDLKITSLAVSSKALTLPRMVYQRSHLAGKVQLVATIQQVPSKIQRQVTLLAPVSATLQPPSMLPLPTQVPAFAITAP